MLSRISTLAAALLLVSAVGHSAGAQDPIVRKAQCRLTVGTSIRHYGSALLLRMSKCHQLRMKATLPPAIDCNDPPTWAANGYVAGSTTVARDVARLRGQMMECRPSPQTPAEVGYTNCPAPCAALPVATFPEVGECLKCLADACVTSAFQGTYGAPPLPIATAPRKCQEAVGRRSVVYLDKSMLLQQNCQFRAEIGQPDFVGGDCSSLDAPTHPYADGVSRARLKVLTQVTNRCTGVDLAGALDTCGGDPAAETACAVAAIDACALALFDATYPPLP